MGEASIFSIPGNIKQAHLPFQLDGSLDINKRTGKVSNTFKGKKPVQYFSYRTIGTSKHKTRYGGGNFGQISICPKSALEYSSNDIGFQKSGINFDGFLDNIPAVQIREFLPDSKLDQAINWMSQLKAGFNAASSDGEDSGDLDALKQAWKNTKPDKGYYFTKLSCITTKFWNVLWESNMFKTAIEKQELNFNGVTSDFKGSIFQIPYLLYYRLMSCVTTNVYEVPYDMKQIIKTQGQNGWVSNNQFGNLQTSSNSIFGTLLGMIAPNLTINISPSWKPQAYDNQEVSIQFRLFNDSVESAVNNFIFINTIFPGNMWMQYHIYQHSPDLYDIKIEGFSRLYMCAGNFQCDAKGVMRTVPEGSKLYKDLKGKMNTATFNLDDPDMMQFKDIKIPDIYEVTLNFKSLLPNNFNNYLYQYSINNNVVNVVEKNGAYQDSAYTSLQEGMTRVMKQMSEYYNSGLVTDMMKEAKDDKLNAEYNNIKTAQQAPAQTPAQ